MPEDFRLIVDLVLVLAAATIGGLLASLLRQPAILGYLIGGIIVGPGGLGVIKELIQVETLAQFGVAFLLFALGVEFSFAELKKVQGISLGGGGLQIIFTILITALTMGILGWDTSSRTDHVRNFSRTGFSLGINVSGITSFKSTPRRSYF